jgi:hypothetical protein
MRHPASAGAIPTPCVGGGGRPLRVSMACFLAAAALAASGAGVADAPGSTRPAGANAGAGGVATGRTTTVAYQTLVNGQEAPEEGIVRLECRDGIGRIRTEPAGRLRPEAPEESGYIDYGARRTWQTALLRDGSRSTVLTEFATLPVLEATADSARVLGYACRRWKAVIRSNQIDVWATTAVGALGTPSLNLVVPDGLVLRVVRNNNYELLAVRIDSAPDTTTGPLTPADWGEIVDAATYRARLTESWITTVTVFDREQIAFGNEIHNPASEDSLGVYRFAGGTVILRRVDLPDVSDDTMILAEVTQYSNGDAYDRTGSIFLIPATGSPQSAAMGAAQSAATGGAGAQPQPTVSYLDALRTGIEALPVTRGSDGKTYQGIVAAEGYAPPIELVRFITPFGIRYYNEQVKVLGMTWEDSALYKLDVSDLLPALRGRVWIGAFIGNYDRGGHILGLKLRYHPGSRTVGVEPRRQSWVFPLFNTVNLMEMAGQEYGRIFAQDSLAVVFEVPEGVEDCHLRYITTGHGGWENGDEFNPKLNEVFLDGRRVAGFVPWRSDCAAYRRLNPSSGNFWNGISSSDLSRSGWCPGAAVDPVTIPLPGLAPGRHVLKVAIPLGPTEGGSFSAWNVSGVLLGRF